MGHRREPVAFFVGEVIGRQLLASGKRHRAALDGQPRRLSPHWLHLVQHNFYEGEHYEQLGQS